MLVTTRQYGKYKQFFCQESLHCNTHEVGLLPLRLQQNWSQKALTKLLPGRHTPRHPLQRQWLYVSLNGRTGFVFFISYDPATAQDSVH